MLSSTEFVLRDAKNADRDCLIDLVSHCLEEFDAPFDATHWDKDLMNIEEHFFGPGGGMYVVTTTEGEIVGSIGIAPEEEVCFFLSKMYVKAQYRGCGLGKKLLRHSLEEARRKGAKRIRLNTIRTMSDAIRLYESFGFKQVSQIFDSPRSDFLYELEL